MTESNEGDYSEQRAPLLKELSDLERGKFKRFDFNKNANLTRSMSCVKVMRI